MSTINGCGCGLPATPSHGVGPKPVQQALADPSEQLRNAFVNSKVDLPIDTSSNEGLFRSFDATVAARKQRLQMLKEAVQADAARNGVPNAIGTQRIVLEEKNTAQIAELATKARELAPHLNPADRINLGWVLMDANKAGSMNLVAMMTLMVDIKQRAGILNQPAADALRGVSTLLGSRQHRANDISVAVANDEMKSGVANPQAQQQLQLERNSIDSLSYASMQLESVGSRVTAEQSQRIAAATREAQASGSSEALVGVIGKVYAETGGH